MKQRNWLDIAEYVSLFGTGVGTVASAASQQIFYTAAPLSFLMLLNLANRRRLQLRLEQELVPAIAQLDHRVFTEVEALNHKVEVLPDTATLDRLKNDLTKTNQSAVSQLAKRITQLQQEMATQTAPLKEHSLSALRHDIHRLQERGAELEDSLGEVSTYLYRLATAAKVETLETTSARLTSEFNTLKAEVVQLQTSLQGVSEEQKVINPRTLQDQIDHLNRRLSNLPQPFDASSLKKDIESLLNVVTDLVPRRELARLLADLEKIHQQQSSLEQSVTVVRLASNVFRKQLDTISSKLNAKEEALNWLTGAVAFQPETAVNEELKASVTKLSRGLTLLQQRVNQVASTPDPAIVQRQVEAIVTTQFNTLQQQLATVQQAAQVLEQEQVGLRGLIDRLPQTSDTDLAQQLNTLQARVDWAENSLNALQAQVLASASQPSEAVEWGAIDDAVLQRLSEISQQAVEEALQKHLATLSQASGERDSGTIDDAVLQRLNEISQQAVEEALHKRLSEMPLQQPSASETADTLSLQAFSNDLAPDQSAPDLAELRRDLEQLLANRVNALEQQLTTVQQTTHTLEQEQTTLRNLFNQQPEPSPSSGLEQQLNSLSARVEWAENNLGTLQAQVENAVQGPAIAPLDPIETALVQDTLDDFAEALTHLESPVDQNSNHHPSNHNHSNYPSVPPVFSPTPVLPAAPPQETELIFDLPSDRPQAPATIDPLTSRGLLEEALDQTRERLIIVCPYPTPDTIDEPLLQRFEAVLSRGGRIDIGWGHLAEANKLRAPRCLGQPAIDAEEKGFLQTLLRQLSRLKKRYSSQFRFKILGTHENFLVCDRTFAILGVHPIATTSNAVPHLAMGLRTRDTNILQNLIDRFDAPDPAPNDGDAYFNRGTTRYDLGDRPGAISDYSRVIELNPQDDIAYNNRGLARYELGDRASAILDFNNALQINPNNAVVYFNRGSARVDLGDQLGCIADFSQAIQYQPAFALAYFNRGMARNQLGNRAGAIDDYSQVIVLNPEDGMSYFYRGVAYFRRGDRPRATSDLQRAEKLFAEQKDKANHRRVREAMKELESALVEASIGATEETPFWPL